MSTEEEHIKELEISTFSKPILRQMGIKAIFLVTFDIILGPIAYISRLTPEKSEYLDFLRNLAHLGEFYTGISHAHIDKVTTSTGEELIVGREMRKIKETELIDIAVALVDSKEYQTEISKMLKFAIRTSYGNPKNFSSLIDKICFEYQDIGIKKVAIESKTIYKDLVKEKQKSSTKLYENWTGILFVDFEADKINSSFLPDWIEATKIDPIDITEKVQQMYAQGIILPKEKQKFTMVSLKSKQAIVLSTSNLRYCSIMFPTAKGLTKINQIIQEFDILNEAISSVGLDFDGNAMKKTLEIIDQRIRKEQENHTMKAVVELMIKAESLMPKKLVTVELYETIEGELQKKFFSGFEKAYMEFDGTKTIMEIAHKTNSSLEQMADFLVFCKTRGIVQVFTKSGRKP